MEKLEYRLVPMRFSPMPKLERDRFFCGKCENHFINEEIRYVVFLVGGTGIELCKQCYNKYQKECKECKKLEVK